VESYLWAAKDDVLDAGVELPRYYGLPGSSEQDLTSGCRRYRLVPSPKRDEDQVTTS